MVDSSPLERGNIGIGVNKMQAYLNMLQDRGLIITRNRQDGVFGDLTEQAVREWQSAVRLPIDGMIGNNTWDSIVNKLRQLNIVTNVPLANPDFVLTIGDRGISVFKMQEYLNEIAANNKCLRPIPVDGKYGPRTATMVQQYQYLYDLNIDGMIGKNTWDSIVNVRNRL